jgi:hypothetical protein
MKRTYVVGSMVAAGLAVLLSSAVPANATWMMAKGNAAQVQDVQNFTDPIMHMGWGLDCLVKSSTAAWIHIPVPSNGDVAVLVRKIKLSFESRDDTRVTEIHVYDGETKIHEFTGNWPGVWNLKLDLGSPYAFRRGLGISIKVETGSDTTGADPHHFYLYCAGANFIFYPPQ